MNAQSSVSCSWQLSALLKDWVEVDRDDDVVVTGVSQHSGDTTCGDLFLATAGEYGHGLQHCTDAISNGAAAIAWEPIAEKKHTPSNYSVPAIEFKQLSRYVGDIASRCYGDLSARIKTIAITGTDGKSSVAHLTAQALEKLSEPCGLIGTLGYGRLSNLTEATHTTPPITRIAKEFANIAQAGCEYVALEASSHGIAQNRLQKLNIHTAVLTNITRDHLDYHHSIEDYIQAKAKLFFSLQPSNVVLNYDDVVGRGWIEQLRNSTNVLTYSFVDSAADIYATNVKYSVSGVCIDICILEKMYALNVPLMGKFNVMNILAVVAVLLSLEKQAEDIVAAIQEVQAVPGRMQIIKKASGPTVIVDFAHTPAALVAAIEAVRQHVAGKLVCVFGCGGNRDAGKRAEMGAVASSNADYTVITSDNPRAEDPDQIIEQIVEGCGATAKFKTISDRKEAIAYALEMVGDQDAVLIAGKGHEKYQLLGENKIAFDDVDVATKMINQTAHE